MSTERMLHAALGQYQSVHDYAQTQRILGTTTNLLANLSNPLNLTLLTSHFLAAPAIWQRSAANQAGLVATSLRVISIFNSAAINVRRNELGEAFTADTRIGRERRMGGGLGCLEWAKAVLKGADDRSARWQHLLVLTGVLMGLEGNERRSLSWSMRGKIEGAVITAANLALEEAVVQTWNGQQTAEAIVLALTYALPLLSDHSRDSINCDALLPHAVRTLIGPECFQGGRILGVINADSTTRDNRLHWPPTTASFRQLQQVDSLPFVSAAGPLARLVAFAIERARSADAVLHAQDELCAFAASMAHQWAASPKLSGFDISLEMDFLSAETAQATWPVLWQHLKKILYATVVVLQAIVGRGLLDNRLRADTVAPVLASKTLRALRDLYFISSRQGAYSFDVYTFTYLASIDVLTRYPQACAALLEETPPNSTSSESLTLTQDLYYLNLAEHFAIALPPAPSEALIIERAMRYITPNAAPSTPSSRRMTDIFEAAHSAILAAMSNPSNAPITARLAPFYADALFASFPSHISARQFRLAFKTMMQILSPPFPIAATHPQLAETLLEMVRLRADAASGIRAATTPLAPRAGELEDASVQQAGPVSEQSALVLTMVDALPFLRLGIVEEWMSVAAETVWRVEDAALREVAKQRLWDVLVSGEMDVERAAIGVAWWGTKGGGEMVMRGPVGGREQAGGLYLMSGAIGGDSAGCSKL